MYRHSPVRNPRSKGIKIKNVLQVCLLVAVCFWLIFQLKRSHDKHKDFEANHSKLSLTTRTPSGDEIAKLGRKDLQPKVDKITKDGEEHEQEDEDEQHDNKHEDEEQDEHEENKHEDEEHGDSKHGEEEQDDDKIENEKDDGGEGGDDEIDENEQDKSDVEIEREEVDAVDEDKETEENGDMENENEEKEKDGPSQIENEVSSNEHDQDGATEHTHEAREEHYKADDASSAVTHEGRTLGTENQIKNVTSVNISENLGQTADNVTSSDITTMQEDTKAEPLVSNGNPTSSINDFRENGPPSNTTMITSESTETENATESQEGSSNSTDITSEVRESNETSLDTNNETEGTEETVEPDEIQHDPIDESDPLHDLEEKEVRTDLDTLPEIETEGGNSEDTAAE